MQVKNSTKHDNIMMISMIILYTAGCVAAASDLEVVKRIVIMASFWAAGTIVAIIWSRLGKGKARP